MSPTPLSVHSDISFPIGPHKRSSPIENLQHQEVQPEAAQHAQQWQPPHHPYHDLYYEPISHPVSIQGDVILPQEVIPKKNKVLDELKEQLKALTQKIAERSNDLTQLQNYNLYPEAHYPVGFKMPRIEKFTGTTPPELHLKSYVRAMKIYDVGEVELAKAFHLTLAGPAQSWFLGLEKHRVQSWRDIVNEFNAQYKMNEELKITRKHLEMAKQKEDESVSEFVTRWRALATQMVERMDEEEQLGMIVKNLKTEIRNKMGHQFFDRFKALLHVGNEIEKELAKQAEANESIAQYKKASTTAANQISTYNHFAQSNIDYSANSFATVTNISSSGYKSHNNNRGANRVRLRKRKLLQLPGNLSMIYKQLKDVGMIYPPNPRPMPNPVPTNWNLNESCEYHQNMGHTTNDCIALRNTIWDLIEAGKIPDPSLLNHQGLNIGNHRLKICNQ
ncbi:hypothetical protein LguiA_012730 [Lonicera macranthoides]